MTVITGLENVSLVPTPVQIVRWGGGRHERTEEQLRAKLFDGPPRPATIVASNVYGEPFTKLGHLSRVLVRPSSRRTPWEISVEIRPKQKRGHESYVREFPDDTVLLIWGHHEIDLSDLPPPTNFLRWHCPSFGPAWREVANRCYAAAPDDVWLDTIGAAVKANELRHRSAPVGAQSSEA
jgi:hypothetical protein